MIIGIYFVTVMILHTVAFSTITYIIPSDEEIAQMEARKLESQLKNETKEIKVLIQEGDFEAALSEIEDLKRPFIKGSMLISVAQNYCYDGKNEQAITLLKEAHGVILQEKNPGLRATTLAFLAEQYKTTENPLETQVILDQAWDSLLRRKVVKS